MKRYWGGLVCTAFACGLIAQYLTAHYGVIVTGNEIWIEIPFVIGLTVSVWVIK